MKKLLSLMASCATLAALPFSSVAQGVIPGPGRELEPGGPVKTPVVSLRADPFRTAEPCPVCLVAPAILYVERSEPADSSLTVYLETTGTAVPGLDYQRLPPRVVIPAGEKAAKVTVMGLDDLAVEGPEVIIVRITTPPPVAAEGYIPALGASEAFVVIGDTEEGARDAQLDIIEPSDLSKFREGASIKLTALTVALSTELEGPVQFFANGGFIGESEQQIWDRVPIPGLPRFHSVIWSNAPAGRHLVTATTKIGPDTWLDAPPLHLIVSPGGINPEPEPAIISIKASRTIAEETSEPLRRIPLVGEFTVTRKGSTNEPLSVYLSYSGTANSAEDCSELPGEVVIPAGETSVSFLVTPKRDEVREGIETLIATISNCDGRPRVPAFLPCSFSRPDPAADTATVFLRDDGITEASLSILKPHDGDSFRPGQPIRIEAIAIDLNSYISHVEFFAGETKIGESTIVFIRAPDPGSPIFHSFEWTDAPPGEHSLTVRAPRGERETLSSPPVKITVGGAPGETPKAGITKPSAGSEFDPGTPIEIVATAVDPDGYVPQMEFFANGRKIGEANIAFFQEPSPGEKQTFDFLWRAAAPGTHSLTVRAIDNSGLVGVSEPVEIRVLPRNELPPVTVFARDPIAVEPQDGSDLDTATIYFRRGGSADEELTVRYTLEGTAQNGVDFENLPGQVVFAKGEKSASVTIRPLADNLAEEFEALILTVAQPFTDAAPLYQPSSPNQAVVVIADRPVSGAVSRPRIQVLPDGAMNVGFPAEAAANFRIEASSDLKTWETVSEPLSSDGVLYFIEEQSIKFPQRFYRMTPAAEGAPEE